LNAELLIRNARLLDGRLVSIAVEYGRISAIAEQLEGTAQETKDAAGRLVLPGFVEAHCHLDKNLTLERVGNASGTLMEAIENWVAFKPKLTHADYLERVVSGLRMALLNGVTALRTHVDVSVVGGLTALEAVLEARGKFVEAMDVQIVALGGAGIDDAETEMIEAAMMAGADVVGGCPWITPDPTATVRAAFELAEKTGKPVDLHVDETENPGVNTLEVIARETLERGMNGRVTVGHCCSLEFMMQPEADDLMELVARAGLHVVSLPACNLNLQGRGMHPAPRGLTRVAELLARGVNVSFGSDNVQDPFHPIGDYDPLKAANLGVIAAHLSGSAQMLESLEMVTTRPASALRLEGYGLEVGDNADFVVLDALTPLEVLSRIPTRLAVYKRGKLVAGNNSQRRIMDRLEVSAWT
jgi:cytosine/creatinine deaminase